MKPEVTKVSLDRVIPAEWNYKYKGTEEEIVTLSKSIKHDDSAGVFAVREVTIDGEVKLEVMDGNHRLDAVKLLQWDEVLVENFGPISKAKAVTISKRRNTKWFDDDILKLSTLIKDDVLDEYSLDDLAEIMPENIEDIENLINLGEYDWVTPVEKQEEEKKESRNVSITMEEGLWLGATQICDDTGKGMSDFVLECVRKVVYAPE